MDFGGYTYLQVINTNQIEKRKANEAIEQEAKTCITHKIFKDGRK